MRTERLIHIVAGSRRAATCKFCGRAIEWATSAKGKNIPLNASAILLHTRRNDQTGVRFDVFGANAVHIATCPKWPKQPSPSSRARPWAGGRS